MRNDFFKTLSTPLVLDGAMATEFRRMGHDMCGELLTLCSPDAVLHFHREYMEAGADVIKTVTFGASPLSPVHGIAREHARINSAAVRLARAVAGESERRVMVAGDIGPGFVPLSGKTEEEKKAYRDAFRDQARVLVREGVDMLMVETLYDAENARLAACGLRDALDDIGLDIPLLFSATVRSMDGRLPSGHSIDDFLEAVSRGRPAAVGLNCCEGPDSIEGPLRQMSLSTSLPLFAFPSAGLQSPSGEYPWSPGEFALAMSRLSRTFPLVMAGGCCGTTPAHIRSLSHEFMRTHS